MMGSASPRRLLGVTRMVGGDTSRSMWAGASRSDSLIRRAWKYDTIAMPVSTLSRGETHGREARWQMEEG